jgi:hypothetical protein
MRDLGPKSLIDELQWMSSLKGGNQAEGMGPFVFRFNWMNGMLASWLVRGSKIDMYTKSLFVIVGAQAVAGVDAETINAKFAERLGQIGKEK